MSVLSPFSGRVRNLAEAPKTKFARKMLGEGIGVEPTEGRATSPVNGEVVQVFPTKHAVTIATDSNVELMIQVGMESNELEGKGFQVHVKEKDQVKKGDPLITFDVDLLKNNLTSILSPVVVVNPNKIKEIHYTDVTNAKHNQTILYDVELAADGDSME